MDRLQVVVNTSKRLKERSALMFLDLDRFKNVNDTLGHNVGDILLQEVAERLKSCSREVDTVCRLGGDEFVMILPNVGEALDIARVAERVIKAVAAPFVIKGNEINTGTSIGISIYPDDSDTAEKLLKNADMAMYRAKTTRRGTYEFYTHKLDEEVILKSELENKLKKDIEAKNFEMFYQPVVESESGRIVGAEALLRWVTEEGYKNPDTFLKIIEDNGDIVNLTEYVFDTVFEFSKRLKEKCPCCFHVAVNLSYKQFTSPDLFEIIKKYSEKHDLSTETLVLEIDEHCFIKDGVNTILIAKKLQSMGIKITIDDFGTGFSSFKYLKELPVDRVKIDKSMLCTTDQGEDELVICKAVTAIASQLGLQVAAEGVELENQRDKLAKLGCDIMQGHLFNKAMKDNEFFDVLTRAGFSC